MTVKSTDETLVDRQLFRLQNEINVLGTRSREIIRPAIERHRELTEDEWLKLLEPARYIYMVTVMKHKRVICESTNMEGRV